MRHFSLLTATLTIATAVACTGAGAGCLFAQKSASQNTVSSTNVDIVKIVATADIMKFDAKKKTFEIKLTFDNGVSSSAANRPPQQNQSTYPPMGGGRRGGMGGMGGGRRNYPSNNPSKAQTTLKVKVFGSDNTVIRDGDDTIKFTTLKDGQRVTITGIHRASGVDDIEALEISRTTSGGN